MFTSIQAMQSVTEAASRFTRTCSAVSDPQWVARSAPGHWSIGDVAEHVTIATDNMLHRLQSIHRHPLDGRSTAVSDDEIPYLFYRGDEPPNVATPTGLMHSSRAAFGAFEAKIDGIDRWFVGNAVDLRSVGAPHPVFGLLDGVQWLLFCAAHIERHRAQIIGEQQRFASRMTTSPGTRQQ